MLKIWIMMFCQICVMSSAISSAIYDIVSIDLSRINADCIGGNDYVKKTNDATFLISIIDELRNYDQTILNKLFRGVTIVLVDAIIKNKRSTSGLFCAGNTIIISKHNSESDSDYNRATLHHEIYHFMDYALKHQNNKRWNEYNMKWIELNEYKYDHDAIVLKKGFVTKYGMTRLSDDKATLYEDFMTLYYSKVNKISYDNIMIAKLRLMLDYLIEYDKNFMKLIELRNKKTKYKYFFLQRDDT